MSISSTVIGPRIQLQSRGGLYALQGVQCRFASNGVNICVATLAVGRREDSSSVVNAAFHRGDEARILVNGATALGNNGQQPLSFTKDDFTLFDGVIDDFGPGNLEYGQFSIQVRIFGRLAYLASGTLGTSNIVPSSHLDTGVYFAWGVGTTDNPAQMSLTLTQTSLWNELQNTLQRIAVQQQPGPPNSVVKLVQDMFGANVNQRAFTILEEIQGSLSWSTQARAFAAGIVANLNMLMMSQWQFSPFLQRLVEIGEMLRFKVIENGSAIRVVPYVPFFRRFDALVITPRSYDQFRWDASSEYRNYAGCVLVEGAHHDIVSSGSASVVGSFKIGGEPQGQVHVGTVPAWLTRLNENMFTGGGEEARAFSAIEEQTGLGDRLAKYMTWDLNYKNRRFTVSCPFFRTDISPLSAIRVDYPSIPEITGGTADLAVYGSVETVDIAIDATAAQCRTTYTVGYARSFQQQKDQIDAYMNPLEHPFFTRNFIGGRLDSDQVRSQSAG